MSTEMTVLYFDFQAFQILWKKPKKQTNKTKQKPQMFFHPEAKRNCHSGQTDHTEQTRVLYSTP